MLFEEQLREILPPGWTVENESVITCPCGHRIELDGECPEGHKSPLLTLGLI